MLHYRRTSEMAAALFRRANAYAGLAEQREQLMAYALGYACHVATDVAGHPFVNEQCGGPFRTHWQRHHMVENHIDAWNYRETKPGHSLPRDGFCGATEDYPELAQSALYFAVQLSEDDPNGDLRRPLPPTDPNIVRAPGDAKGLTPLQRSLRTAALDTDGDMPEWLAAEIVHALYETYGADAAAKPSPLAPRNLKGFDFQTTVVEPAAHDDYGTKYGLNASNVPVGFPLPWEVQVSYKFMLSYFKRGFMDGFDLPLPRPPQPTAASSSDSAVTGAQVLTAAANTRGQLQALAAAIGHDKERIRRDLGLSDDTLLNRAEAALGTAMNAYDGAITAISGLAGFLDTPVRLLFDSISVLTMPYRLTVFSAVTLPMWNALRAVRADLVQRGFLTPQDAEFLPDGTRLHDTEIDRRHVQLGFTGPAAAAPVDTGYGDTFVASQGDGAGGWSGGFSLVGGQSFPGRRVTVGRNDDDGRLEAFLIGTDAVVYHTWQDKPNGSWGTWSRLTPVFPVEAVDLAVATNKDGRLEAFLLGADYGIYHTWQTFNVLGLGKAWSPVWVRIGGPGSAGVELAVGIGAGDRLAAFVIGTDGNVYAAAQQGVNADFGGWSEIADPAKELGAGKPVHLATARNADGTLVLVLADDHGGVHCSHQQGDASMGPWSPLGGLPPGRVSTVRGAVACARDGRGVLTVAACGIDGEVYISSQSSPGGGFAAWSTLPGRAAVLGVALAANPDGSLECVTVDASSTMWATSRFQTNPWSAWQLVGAAPDRGKSVRLMPNADGKLQAFIDGVNEDPALPAPAGSRNTQGKSYPFLPVDDEFRLPSAYPDRALTGAPNALESQPTVAGPFPHDTPAHALLLTDGPADNDLRRLYEQAQSPHDTDCLNEQFVGHGDTPRTFTNPLGTPVLFSAYLIGRLNAPAGAPPVANFNLDSDRAYGYLCWDWVRNPAVTAAGYNDPGDPFNVPSVAPSVQGDSKIVGGVSRVWAQAAQRWQAQGNQPLQLRYVPGAAAPPPHANDPATDCVPLGSQSIAVVPAGIPLGVPVNVTIAATDDRTGRALRGSVLVNGSRAGRLGAAFQHVFAESDTVVSSAYGYADVTVAMPFDRFATVVDPSPTPFNVPVQLTVFAKDARTGAPVAATVTLTTFDVQGNAVGAQFPANAPYPVVLRNSKPGVLGGASLRRPAQRIGGGGPGDPPEPPWAVVRAPGYADAEVDFIALRPPPLKRMTVTVSPPAIPIGRPATVTVQAVDAASGATVAGTVLVAGAPAGTTGTPFPYTFGSAAPEAHVTAAGYADGAVTWPAFYTPVMNVTVAPSPAPFNKPIQLVVHAVDSRSGTPVAGTVTLVNYGIGGAAVSSHFPTETPFGTTLRVHTIKPVKGNDGQTFYPAITAQAQGYADVTVALGSDA